MTKRGAFRRKLLVLLMALGLTAAAIVGIQRLASAMSHPIGEVTPWAVKTDTQKIDLGSRS